MKKSRNWAPEEDSLLMTLYEEVTCFQRWKIISQKMKEKGINKTQLQCRQRFFNKLDPNLRHDRVQTQEVKSIFNLYNEYGPLWSVFESLIPGRNQNMIKNKFYSTLRSLVRLIVLCGSKNCSPFQRLPSLKLSSKLLVDIYDGKKEFKKFKGLLPQCLRKIEFEVDSKQIERLKNMIDPELLLNLICTLRKLNILKKEVEERLEIECEKQKKEETSTQKLKLQVDIQESQTKKDNHQNDVHEGPMSINFPPVQQFPQISHNLIHYGLYGSQNMNQPYFPLWFYSLPSFNQLQ